jgi:N-acetylglucosamine kinase-like BadF-type ATPase
MTPVIDVLAVDGGNSKVDVALVSAGGEVLGAARGRGASFTPDSMQRSVATLLDAVTRACADAFIDVAERPLARVGALCLAGDDLPVDDRRLRSALRPLGLAADLRVRNDTFAVLRAGTERDWGIGVVCGTGMNCAGVAPDGRTVRFAAIGQVSGDDGGGGWVGRQAVRAAVRGHDGRDPHTALEREVPAHLGKRSLLAVLEGIQSGELDDSMSELAPLVFRCAADGDEVAQGIVDAQADEVVAMVTSAARRLHVLRRDVAVVLGGGLIHAGDGSFLRRMEAGIRAAVPAADVRPLRVPPVVGAALLGLDRLAAPPGAGARVRRALTQDRILICSEG